MKPRRPKPETPPPLAVVRTNTGQIKIADHQLGWMAGVIDLKGRIIVKHNKQRRTRQLVLVVETQETQVVQELGRMTGTALELKMPRNMPDFMRHGCVEHCPTEHVHVKSEMPSISRWTVTGSAMAVVVYNLLPFMRNDRGLLKGMQEIFQMTPKSGAGRNAIDQSIKRMAELGWEIPEELMSAKNVFDIFNSPENSETTKSPQKEPVQNGH